MPSLSTGMVLCAEESYSFHIQESQNYSKSMSLRNFFGQALQFSKPPKTSCTLMTIVHTQRQMLKSNISQP